MTLNFPQPPSMNGLYLKAALKRGTLSDGGTIPRLEATLEPTLPVPEVLAAYGKVCGAVNSEVVPPCWPHVLAAPLHLALLTHDDFPLRPLGVVHTRNRITVHRALPIGAPLGVRCWVEGHRQHRLGVEFDLETEVELSLEDVLTGAIREVAFTRLDVCEACSGSGARPGTEPERCSRCDGAGQVTQAGLGGMFRMVTARTRLSRASRSRRA